MSADQLAMNVDTERSHLATCPQARYRTWSIWECECCRPRLCQFPLRPDLRGDDDE